MKQNLFGLDNSLQVPSIPYMGNKRKLATRIINTIIDVKGQDFIRFYDLFGGGGSMSIAALNLWGVEVHYNELNTAIVNLMKHIQRGGEIPYKWVTRDEFFKCLEGDTWWDGLVQSCWAFGNNGAKGYLYGKEVEDLKLLGHRICVDKDYSALKILETYVGHSIELDLTKGIHEIRIDLKNRCDELNLIENLSRNLHLERLQNLQNLQNLQITNLSYSDVVVKDNSIIYCDPPYKGTEEYKKGGFNHDEFYEWCIDNENSVFISEYQMPNEFKLIASFEHKSTLSATNNDKKVIENLYWNGK